MTFAENLTQVDAAGRLGVSRQIGQDLIGGAAATLPGC